MTSTALAEDLTPRLDAAVTRRTMWRTFAELLAACNRGAYRPTLRRDLLGDDADLIADAYDAEMKRRGDPRRAFRG